VRKQLMKGTSRGAQRDPRRMRGFYGYPLRAARSLRRGALMRARRSLLQAESEVAAINICTVPVAASCMTRRVAGSASCRKASATCGAECLVIADIMRAGWPGNLGSEQEIITSVKGVATELQNLVLRHTPAGDGRFDGRSFDLAIAIATRSFCWPMVVAR